MIDEQHAWFYQDGRDGTSDAGIGGRSEEEMAAAGQRPPHRRAGLAHRLGAGGGGPGPRQLGAVGGGAGRLPVRAGGQQPCAGGCWPASRASAARPDATSPTTSSACSSTWCCPPRSAATWCAPGICRRRGVGPAARAAAGGRVPERLRRPPQRPGRAGGRGVPGRRCAARAAAAVDALDRCAGRRRRDAGRRAGRAVAVGACRRCRASSAGLRDVRGRVPRAPADACWPPRCCRSWCRSPTWCWSG